VKNEKNSDNLGGGGFFLTHTVDVNRNTAPWLQRISYEAK